MIREISYYEAKSEIEIQVFIGLWERCMMKYSWMLLHMKRLL